MQSKWDTSCLSVSWAACAVVFGHLLLHNLLRLTLKNKSFVLYASTLTGSVAGTREGKRSRRYYSDNMKPVHHFQAALEVIRVQVPDPSGTIGQFQIGSDSALGSALADPTIRLLLAQTASGILL
jgi:hypothetical protein